MPLAVTENDNRPAMVKSAVAKINGQLSSIYEIFMETIATCPNYTVEAHGIARLERTDIVLPVRIN
jgi:hypothetical protein